MPPEERSTETTTIRIAGMTCDNCARRVERALRGLAGVKDVAVNRPNGSAKVTFSPDQVDIASLHEAVRESGYQPLAAPSG